MPAVQQVEGSGDREEQWFAVHLRSHHENIAAEALRARGFEVFLPKFRSRRIWSDRIKELDVPLFPGYIFCRIGMHHRLTDVLTAAGVLSVVTAGKRPAAVDDSEIAALQNVVAAAFPVEPCPETVPGTLVRVIAGALAGVEGKLVRIKGRERLVLSISLLRRSVAVEIDRALAQPMSTDEAIRAVLRVTS